MAMGRYGAGKSIWNARETETETSFGGHGRLRVWDKELRQESTRRERRHLFPHRWVCNFFLLLLGRTLASFYLECVNGQKQINTFASYQYLEGLPRPPPNRDNPVAGSTSRGQSRWGQVICGMHQALKDMMAGLLVRCRRDKPKYHTHMFSPPLKHVVFGSSGPLEPDHGVFENGNKRTNAVDHRGLRSRCRPAAFRSGLPANRGLSGIPLVTSSL